MSKMTNPQIPFDMTDRSAEEQIRLLNQLIDAELKKPPTEADTDLIAECSDYIRMLIPQAEQVPAAELDRIYGQILAGKETLSVGAVAEPEVPTAHAIEPKKRVRTVLLRTVAILAAAFLLLFGALSVVAAVQGYANALELIKAKAAELFGMELGETAEYGNITVVKNGTGTEYDSAEAFIKTESLPILLPTGLTGELRPIKILMYDTDTEGHYSIGFVFNNNEIGITVQNQYSFSDPSSLKDASPYTTEAGYGFTVIVIQNDYYQAVFHKDGYEYIITAPDELTLQTLMNSMKEVS